MKILLQTIAVAFSLFSAVPMPQFAWNEHNMRYQLIAFPLVGVITALLVWAWVSLAGFLGWGQLLFAAGLVAIPIVVTGGFHMDGFCDTQDAIASHQPMERKLEIMEDSHTGAFAVIWTGVYLVAYLGFATEVEPTIQSVIALSCLYVMTRAASGLAVAKFPMASSSGLAKTFSDMASRNAVGLADALIALGAAAAAAMFAGLVGAAMVAGVLIVFVVYRIMSEKVFGGVTGDLAGWFLQVAELAGVAGMAVAYAV